MVHRDFKPDNVLVGGDGRVRVSDFGLAQLVDPGDGAAPAARTSVQATMAGAVAGTPAYMAPEQFEGRTVDARTDQFAFCVALWEALCGERPFCGEDFWTVRRNVLAGELRVPPRERPLPGWLRSVLLRGLSMRPEQRFDSLEELLSALRRDRRRRLLRRTRLGATALLLFAGASSLGISHHRERTRCAREAESMATTLLGEKAGSDLRGLLLRAGLGIGEAAEASEALEDFFAGWRRAWSEQCEIGRADPRRAAPAASCLEHAGLRARATLSALVESEQQPGSNYTFRLIAQLPGTAECLRPRPSLGDRVLDPRWAQLEETRVLSLLGRDSLAETRLEALLAAAEPEAHAVRAETLRQLASTLWNGRGLAEPAVSRLREAVREADAGGDDLGSFNSRASLADLLNEGLDRREESERAWLDAEAWLVRLGSPASLERRVATGRGHLLSRLGRHEEALAQYQQAARLVDLEGPSGAAHAPAAHINLGSEYCEMGRYTAAIAESRRALDLLGSLRARDELDAILAWGNIAASQLALGRAEQALFAAAEASAVVASLGEGNAEGYRAWLSVTTAQALEQLGRHVEARLNYRRGLMAEESLDSSTLADALAGTARLELAAGRQDSARELAERAMALTASRPWAQGTSTGTRFTLARVLRASRQEPERARALAREALERLTGPEEDFTRRRIEAWLADEPAAGGEAAAR
jgi:tetratricopeptide (TPR) repeat protein